MEKPDDDARRPATSPAAPEEIERAAADWLALQDARDLTAAEQTAFARWLAADPRHAAAVDELAGAWRSLDRLREFEPSGGTPAEPDFFARRRFHRWVLPAAGLAAAAALAAIVVWRQPPSVPASRPLVSAPGVAVTRQLRLPDSSQVRLDVDSEIVEQFTPAERRVRLLRGEAQFAVTKNAARPFVVQAGPVAVRAVGTAFDVRIRADAIEVLVTEGKVRLDASGDSGAAFLFLIANQRAVIPLGAHGALTPAMVKGLRPEEVERALAWESSRFKFNATPLAEVVEAFNRRNPERLRLVDPALGALRISGTFRMNNVDSFVQLLELGFGVGAERRSDGEIVLRKAPGNNAGDLSPK